MPSCTCYRIGGELSANRFALVFDEQTRSKNQTSRTLFYRSEQTKRRTKIISKTNDPQWQQIFYYVPLKESELDDLTLEITVWDYERYKQTNNEFIGEVSC